jgi:hypothetical protein
MYHAKGLGKNQISGNPRPPRRLTLAIEAPRQDRPGEAGPRLHPVGLVGVSHEPAEEDEPDPREMRRQIAAAQRNMDPDHQIRKAMDVFLS